MTQENLRPELRAAVGHVCARWNLEDTRVLKHAFPLLSGGRPVTLDRLAKAAGVSVEDVKSALGRVELDNNGEIAEVFGVKLTPTLHRIELGEATLFTCCALVAHILPRILQRDLDVCSEDPVSREVVEIAIGARGLKSVDPEDAVATMVMTEASDVLDDAPLHLCRHVHHFRSIETADAFVVTDPGRYVVNLAELDAAAAIVFDAVWG